jgi:hypothetical protein
LLADVGFEQCAANFAEDLLMSIDVTPEISLLYRANSSLINSEELQKIHAYWRACNSLSVGMI